MAPSDPISDFSPVSRQVNGAAECEDGDPACTTNAKNALCNDELLDAEVVSHCEANEVAQGVSRGETGPTDAGAYIRREIVSDRPVTAGHLATPGLGEKRATSSLSKPDQCHQTSPGKRPRIMNPGNFTAVQILVPQGDEFDLEENKRRSACCPGETFPTACNNSTPSFHDAGQVPDEDERDLEESKDKAAGLSAGTPFPETENPVLSGVGNYGVISLFVSSVVRRATQKIGLPPKVILLAENDEKIRTLVCREFGYRPDEKWGYTTEGSACLYVKDVTVLADKECLILRQMVALFPGLKSLIVGGSPCQDLTYAGYLHGLLGLVGS